MIHLNGEVGKGSCRSWGGFNLFAALEACSDLLLGFGGHELAAGFTIEADKIPAFRRRINQVAREFRGGQAPVSSLDVDVVLTQPSRVTLEEVDALDALEPYGSGNVRPVFCLTGATLERAQNVGQNRHLKLRLTKGSAQFDGIFFSATADSCGCAVGSRVDAAFYLQVNEFRGIRSIQLQLVDLRPSLAASGREDEALQLLHHCLTGEPVQPKEAQRLMPSREQFVRSWRLLQHIVPIEGLTADYLPLLRTLSAALGGVDPFLRAAFCLEIFAERGLLSCRRAGDQVHLLLTDGGRKVDLESSSYLLRLRDILEKPQRGGGLA
jgi:single-stranded-DNA-specific exonuclease